MSDSFVTPWTVAHQASLLMGFPRQEYWSGLPCPSTQDLPVPGIKPVSPDWQMDSLPLIQLGSPLYPTCVCVSAQSCLTLCSPADCSLPGSSVVGIVQARILKWVAISYSSGSSHLRDWTLVSCVSKLAGRCSTTVPPRNPYIQDLPLNNFLKKILLYWRQLSFKNRSYEANLKIYPCLNCVVLLHENNSSEQSLCFTIQRLDNFLTSSCLPFPPLDPPSLFGYSSHPRWLLLHFQHLLQILLLTLRPVFYCISLRQILIHTQVLIYSSICTDPVSPLL